MRIALGPYMHRHLPLDEALAARLGYDRIELSPRGDALEWFKAPPVPDGVKRFKAAMKDNGVGIAYSTCTTRFSARSGGGWWSPPFSLGWAGFEFATGSAYRGVIFGGVALRLAVLPDLRI